MNLGEIVKFRLYVAGEAQNSVQALRNLTAICMASIPDRYSIDIVDVLKDPGRALADGIFMTPTLLRLSPPPLRRIVGTLSNAGTVLPALGLAAAAT